MNLFTRRLPVAFAAAFLLLAGAASAEAQAVTQADIDRLEVLTNDVAEDVAAALTRHCTLGGAEVEMQSVERIYRNDKQRKGERIARRVRMHG